MTKLNLPYVGFTTAVRLADSLITQPLLMGMKDKYGDPVLLHALKGVAVVMRGAEAYGLVSVNGVGYATK